MPDRSDAQARQDGAETVCAVVVTHNRRDQLRECLDALRGQSRPLDRILVVDNASEDGTAAMLAADYGDIAVHRLKANEGGAGGFHAGLREAYGRSDWMWLMDDDTLPSATALETLIAGRDAARDFGERPALLASTVLWRDGRLHPMNTAVPRVTPMDDLVSAAGHGLLAIRAASFVSVLVQSAAVERFGLPIRRYFIWCDDVEYTGRILRTERGFLVPESVVHHNTETAYTTAEGSPERFFYHARNSVYMARSPAWNAQEKLRIGWVLAIHIRRFLINNRWRPRAVAVVLRALVHGIATPADDGERARLPSRSPEHAETPAL